MTRAQVTRALVLGGTGHVGSAVLRRLHEAGVAAAFTYHRSEHRAVELARAWGHTAHPVDLADANGVRACMARICEHGVPDIAIGCAGYAHAGRLEEIDDETWNRVMDINVRGIFVVCRELGPRMAAQAGGDIVLCIGPDAVGAAPSAPHFAASQAALAGLVRAVAADLGPRGVRVNAVAVGVLDGGAGRLVSAERVSAVARYSALRRVGTADEAARALVWLAMDNPYLCGAVIPVTGGL